MKRLHLVCNSHLDPIWMWDWQEGMASAVSTFYQAVELANEYDFIFCHNEAVLYEFIENHEPTLFAKIKELVSKGKWHIMGGWYLQPDCHIPSGEGFVRQIKVGQDYFYKKFGSVPTTAVNFDSFGHTVGLVQILKKTGYDSYLFCRPMPEMLELKDNVFNWVGLDGSLIKTCRFEDENLYCSGFGTAKKEILRKASKWENKDVGIALWGVGNHGGNPSRKDLEDVADLIKTSDYEILHSTPENFFNEIEPKFVFDKSLNHCHVGAYASVSLIKTTYAKLEQKLFSTEKICSLASIQNGYIYDTENFNKVQKELAFIQFHDVLSGTCVVEGIDSSIRRAEFAMKILDDMYFDAFNSFVEKFMKAQEGSFPMFFFNEFPYERDVVVDSEFLILQSLISDTEMYDVKAFYKGKEIPCQVLKQSCNINYDRRKRIACKIKMNSSTMERIDFYIQKKPIINQKGVDKLVFCDSCKQVVISKTTGLIESYVVNGKEYITGGAFRPLMFDDIPDPWGWGLIEVGKNPKPFKLCNNTLFNNLDKVNVVEYGEILTEVESYFMRDQSYIKISYKIYKDLPYIDISFYVLWNERDKALKFQLPTTLSEHFLGQTAFGIEELAKTGEECPAHRFVASSDKYGNCLALYNKGTYSFSMKDGKILSTLFRGVAYCAHPIEDRPLLPWKRFVPYIEQGKHEFFFRLGVCKECELEKNAEEFCAPIFSLNAYPHGDNSEIKGIIQNNNCNIVIKAFKKSENGNYILRLINNYSESQNCEFKVKDSVIYLNFSKFEVKTLVFDGLTLKESFEMLV